MAVITKDMIISDIIDVDQGLVSVLQEAGMHCVGCSAARGETLEEAAMVHGMNPDELTSKLNLFLEA